MILKTENLTKKYGDFLAVKNVSLEIEKDTIHAIIGPNGAGKTTLFNTLTGEISVTEGKIFFEDMEITDKKPFEVARIGIGRSFQKNNLFKEISVLENIRLAVHALSSGRFNIFKDFTSYKGPIKKSREILDLMGMVQLAEVKAGELSHGEQRKLEIAIALAGNPRLLLLDEPTSGMSPGEAMEMMDLLKQIRKSLTMVVIEHNMDVVLTISGKVTVLHQGEILASDIPSRIVENEEVKKAYLGE